MKKTNSRKTESKQAQANRRAQMLDYLMRSETGASIEEMARHANMSTTTVMCQIRALRSVKHPQSPAMKLAPVVEWERDIRGSASIALYKFGWGYDRPHKRPLSNLQIVRNYNARKKAKVPSDVPAVSSVFALGAIAMQDSQVSHCGE